MANNGLSPVLCSAGSNAVHHHYFGCPVGKVSAQIGDSAS